MQRLEQLMWMAGQASQALLRAGRPSIASAGRTRKTPSKLEQNRKLSAFLLGTEGVGCRQSYTITGEAKTNTSHIAIFKVLNILDKYTGRRWMMTARSGHHEWLLMLHMSSFCSTVAQILLGKDM